MEIRFELDDRYPPFRHIYVRTHKKDIKTAEQKSNDFLITRFLFFVFFKCWDSLRARLAELWATQKKNLRKDNDRKFVFFFFLSKFRDYNIYTFHLAKTCQSCVLSPLCNLLGILYFSYIIRLNGNRQQIATPPDDRHIQI